MKPLIPYAVALLLALGNAAAQESAHDSADAPTLALACSGCHDDAQSDPDGVPRLAGMDSKIFMRNMINFKTGKGGHVSSIMNRIARGYDDAELQKMADYFSRQRAMSQ